MMCGPQYSKFLQVKETPDNTSRYIIQGIDTEDAASLFWLEKRGNNFIIKPDVDMERRVEPMYVVGSSENEQGAGSIEVSYDGEPLQLALGPGNSFRNLESGCCIKIASSDEVAGSGCCCIKIASSDGGYLGYDNSENLLERFPDSNNSSRGDVSFHFKVRMSTYMATRFNQKGDMDAVPMVHYCQVAAKVRPPLSTALSGPYRLKFGDTFIKVDDSKRLCAAEDERSAWLFWFESSDSWIVSPNSDFRFKILLNPKGAYYVSAKSGGKPVQGIESGGLMEFTLCDGSTFGDWEKYGDVVKVVGGDDDDGCCLGFSHADNLVKSFPADTEDQPEMISMTSTIVGAF